MLSKAAQKAAKEASEFLGIPVEARILRHPYTNNPTFQIFERIPSDPLHFIVHGQGWSNWTEVLKNVKDNRFCLFVSGDYIQIGN